MYELQNQQQQKRGAYKVTTAPASEPLSLTEVKSYLKVDNTVDDTLITLLIQSAREEAESYTNQRLMPQTVTEIFNSFPVERYLCLSLSPIVAVSSINYTDEDDSNQLLASSNYVVHTQSMPPLVTLAYNEVWPITLNEGQTVTVVYTVGYADADSVPGSIRNAMLKMIAQNYERREESIKQLPTDAQQLLMYNRVTV